MFKHEDDRRLLLEIEPGDYKACKTVIAKRRCVVGDHHHDRKDERFLLVAGHAFLVVIGEDNWAGIAAPYEWNVPRGKYHRFELEQGSILVGTASEPFDTTDEHHGY